MDCRRTYQSARANYVAWCNYCRFGLFYNTSGRHERHEWDTNDTSTTRRTRVRHECYTNDTSATRVKNFDFHNEMSENIFSHLTLAVWQMKDYKGEEQYHSKNYQLEMPRSHANMRLKSAPQKLNFGIAKAIWKSYKLYCSCTCPCTFLHSYA